MPELLYSFYGDDFTGSTDVLEQLAEGGVRTALFLQPPTAQDLQLIPDLQAVGIAGDSRSQTPEWMSAELPRMFTALRTLGAPVTQYKVCSTFDSSPQRGSIGRALEIGSDCFASTLIPVVVGAPHLRRYVWQGNLFAADPLGNVHRIDRHPMSRHPVTPMREPNLRRHLAAQTGMPMGEITDLGSSVMGSSVERLRARVAPMLAQGCRAVVFDTVSREDSRLVGELIWTEAARKPLFAVGSSGLTAALIGAWRERGLVQQGRREPETHDVAAASTFPLLAISGSCSAATERQLRWALANGFHGISVDPAELLTQGADARSSIAVAALEAMREGKDVVIYTALGTPMGASQGDSLGMALGALLREMLEHAPIPRVLLCGGDTSSQAVKQLGLRALTWHAALQVGVPLCKAHGTGPADGLQLVLKGGQMGTEDFFAVVRDTRA